MAFQSKHSIEEIEEKLDVVSPEIVEKLTRFDKIRSEKSLTVDEIYDGTNKPNKTLNKSTTATQISMDVPLTAPITSYDEIILEMSINSSTGSVFGQKILYLPKNIGYNPTNVYSHDAFNYRESMVSSMANGPDGWEFQFHIWFKDERTLHLFKVFTSWVGVVSFKVTSVKGIRFSGKTLDPLAHVNSQYGIEDTPVGHVMSFMGTKPPRHYLACDGSILNKAEYPYLADLFEDQFGMANYFGGNGTTTFQLPDLRNQFLRGYHGDAAETLSGDIGVKQDPTVIPRVYAYKNPENGKESINIAFANSDGVSDTNDSMNVDIANKSKPYYYMNEADFALQSLDTTALYSYSVRPTNVAVLYCIKYEPTYFVNVVDEQVVLWQNNDKSDPVNGVTWKLAESYKEFDYLYFEAVRSNQYSAALSQLVMASSLSNGTIITISLPGKLDSYAAIRRCVFSIIDDTTISMVNNDSEFEDFLVPWRVIGIRKTVR